MAELILSAKDFKALSSETRVHIIKLLGQRNFNPSELSAKLEMAAPTIKEHLDVLHACDLVYIIDDQHKWKYYALTRKGKKLLEQENNNVMIVLASSFVAVLSFLYWASALFFQKSLSASTPAFEVSIASAPSQVGMEKAMDAASIPVIVQAYDVWLALGLFVVCTAIAAYFYVQVRKVSFDV